MWTVVKNKKGGYIDSPHREVIINCYEEGRNSVVIDNKKVNISKTYEENKERVIVVEWSEL